MIETNKNCVRDKKVYGQHHPKFIVHSKFSISKKIFFFGRNPKTLAQLRYFLVPLLSLKAPEGKKPSSAAGPNLWLQDRWQPPVFFGFRLVFYSISLSVLQFVLCLSYMNPSFIPFTHSNVAHACPISPPDHTLLSYLPLAPIFSNRNHDLDLRVQGYIDTRPNPHTSLLFGLSKKLGEMWNDSHRNIGVSHTPFALPLLLLHFVTFLTSVVVEPLVLCRLILRNTLKSSFWFGCYFQFGMMSSFAEEAAAAVVAAVWLLEIRVQLLLFYFFYF